MVAEMFPGKTSWRSLRTCLTVSLFSCELVRVVPDVIDVPVSPSSVVSKSCVMFLFVALIGNLWNHSPFLSPKSVHFDVQIRRKR